MSSEIESKISGVLVKNVVKISNQYMQNELLSKGYGEKYEKEFFLNSFETLYLTYIKKLKVSKAKKNILFDELIQIYKKNENDVFTKFLIYRDFLVYTKGHFGKNGAKYLVFALNEGTQKKIGYIQKNIEQITKMGKEPIIAVIERRGEVIYYKISKIDFLENKIKSQVQDFDF